MLKLANTALILINHNLSNVSLKMIFPMEELVEVLSVRLFTMLKILSKNGKIQIHKKLFVEGSTFFLHAISPDNFLIISLCSGLLQKTMVRDHSNITSAFF